MSPEKLVRMANQVATFFRAQDAATAPALVADHLEKFWEPRMRAAIIAHGRAGGEGMDPITAEAVMLLNGGKAPP